MSEIKVSIIIPCYNVEKFIEKTLLSAINQTLKEIEIIVVNDGSTDNTLNIIKKYSEKDERIIIVNKKNGGLSSARNAGIKIAKGEYIQHLDGDDWLENNCCEETYNYAKKNDSDIICFDFIREEIKRKYKVTTLENFKENTKYNFINFFEELYKNAFNVNIIFKLIKKELYIRNNISHPVEISLGEDLVTIVKLAFKAKKIGKINKNLYHYMFNVDSLTNSFKGKKMNQLIESFENIDDFIEIENIKLQEIEKEYLALLKIRHLGTFLYCKPVVQDITYRKGVDKFINFVKTEVKISDVKKLGMQRSILYRIIKLYPNKYFLYFLANTNYYLNFVMKRWVK